MKKLDKFIEEEELFKQNEEALELIFSEKYKNPLGHGTIKNGDENEKV